MGSQQGAAQGAPPSVATTTCLHCNCLLAFRAGTQMLTCGACGGVSKLDPKTGQGLEKVEKK
jgi:hypothetical protein